MPTVPLGQIMGVGHRGVIFLCTSIPGYFLWYYFTLDHTLYDTVDATFYIMWSCLRSVFIFILGFLCLTESHRPIGGSHTESDIFNVQPYLILLFIYLLESENRCQISTPASFHSQV